MIPVRCLLMSDMEGDLRLSGAKLTLAKAAMSENAMDIFMAYRSNCLLYSITWSAAAGIGKRRFRYRERRWRHVFLLGAPDFVRARNRYSAGDPATLIV